MGGEAGKGRSWNARELHVVLHAALYVCYRQHYMRAICSTICVLYAAHGTALLAHLSHTCLRTLPCMITRSILPPCSRALATTHRLRVQGLGFRVQGLGLRVQGLGFRVQGLGFRGQALAKGLRLASRSSWSQVSVLFCGLGFRVKVQGLGLRVQALEFMPKS